MANLSSLLGNKSLATLEETNLAQGEVYLYAGNSSDRSNCDFCWLAPADGELVIEVWGAAGSSSKMCCCGMGLPGNMCRRRRMPVCPRRKKRIQYVQRYK